MSKKIGILTSGGDCAGLNAVIRAVTLRAVNKYKWKVFGIKDGTYGLVTDPLNVIELTTNHFDGNLMRMGGTFLGTSNKGNPFRYPQKDGSKKEICEHKKGRTQTCTSLVILYRREQKLILGMI